MYFFHFCDQVDTPQGELPYVDTSHIYHGQVLGAPNSHVFGSIHDGVFEGKIVTDEDSYFVEHARHYFPNGSHHDYGFHSVIYNERDVIDDPFAHKRKAGHVNGCGVNEETLQWMDNIQNAAAVEDEPTVEEIHLKDNIQRPNERATNRFVNDELDSPYFKYSKEANADDDGDHQRSKRATRPREDNRNTCSLYIQTDPLIWRHIREGIAEVSRQQHFWCRSIVFRPASIW